MKIMSLIGAVAVVDLGYEQPDSALLAQISLESTGSGAGMRIVTSKAHGGIAPLGNGKQTVVTVIDPAKAAGGRWSWPRGVFGGLSDQHAPTLTFPHNDGQIGRLIEAFNGKS